MSHAEVVTWAPTPLLRRLLLVAIVAVAVFTRLGPRADLFQDGGVLLSDLDTMRRLAHIEAIDRAGTYPIVETLDGCPTGTTLHWTLPMDWAIRTLDPLLGWLVPGERGYEGGAVVAGPLFAGAAVCVFMLLLTRLLGAGPALLAGLLYALTRAFVATSLLGNGDHQTLQQLAAVVAVLGLLLALQGTTRARTWAMSAGAALGFAVWVSTELMLLFYVLVGVLTVLAAWPWRDPAHRAGARALIEPFGGAVLAVALLGHLTEHRGSFGTLRWDIISLFQLWQIAVFALFGAGLTRVAKRDGLVPLALAGIGAVCVGLLPLMSGDVRAELFGQIQNAGEVNVWLQREVSEFRGLFEHGFSAFTEREGWLPLAVIATLFGLRWSPLTRPAAAAVGLTAVGTFALYAYEVKLGHLYSLTFPVLLVSGWLGFARRFAFEGQRWVHIGAAAVAVWSLVVYLPAPRVAQLKQSDRFVHEIGKRITAARQGRDGGVLAPWDMGARLMYETKIGVVATGYHRNIEGIRDGFRFWFTDVSQRDQAMQLLRRRGVRWVVAWYDTNFFAGGAATIGVPPLRTDAGLLPAVQTTMFWHLRYGSLPGFRLIAEGPEIQRGGLPPEPIYRLFEVTP